jgi:hypothetical protein
MKRIAVASFAMLAVFAAALAAAGLAGLTATPASAAPPFCNCRQVYEPVICSNGQVYSNICFARCDGAKNCQPYGG